MRYTKLYTLQLQLQSMLCTRSGKRSEPYFLCGAGGRFLNNGGYYSGSVSGFSFGALYAITVF